LLVGEQSHHFGPESHHRPARPAQFVQRRRHCSGSLTLSPVVGQ
jgi:hypothetical protein